MRSGGGSGGVGLGDASAMNEISGKSEEASEAAKWFWSWSITELVLTAHSFDYFALLSTCSLLLLLLLFLCVFAFAKFNGIVFRSFLAWPGDHHHRSSPALLSVVMHVYLYTHEHSTVAIISGINWKRGDTRRSNRNATVATVQIQRNF